MATELYPIVRTVAKPLTDGGHGLVMNLWGQAAGVLPPECVLLQDHHPAVISVPGLVVG